jgi:phenylalanyl-tRNA synthetase beta chain
VAWGRAAYISFHEIHVKAILPDVSSFNVDSNTLDIPVEVQNPEACQRYCGITITGIKVGPSPNWLQKRLLAIGLNPINNVVDITNFVLTDWSDSFMPLIRCH